MSSNKSLPTYYSICPLINNIVIVEYRTSYIICTKYVCLKLYLLVKEYGLYNKYDHQNMSTSFTLQTK